VFNVYFLGQKLHEEDDDDIDEQYPGAEGFKEIHVNKNESDSED
jgi:hypothetical protein